MTYKAIYAGNGEKFNLVAVFMPDISEYSIGALLAQLRGASWSVAIVDVSRPNPQRTLELWPGTVDSAPAVDAHFQAPGKNVK